MPVPDFTSIRLSSPKPIQGGGPGDDSGNNRDESLETVVADGEVFGPPAMDSIHGGVMWLITMARVAVVRPVVHQAV